MELAPALNHLTVRRTVPVTLNAVPMETAVTITLHSVTKVSFKRIVALDVKEIILTYDRLQADDSTFQPMASFKSSSVYVYSACNADNDYHLKILSKGGWILMLLLLTNRWPITYRGAGTLSMY